MRDPLTGQINSFNSLLAGSIAGVMATLFTYPADVLKTRMTVNSLISHQQKYSSAGSAFVTIMREEGPATFFRGISPTLLGVIPFSAALYFTYETLDSYAATSRDRLTATQSFVNGCIAGAVAQTVSFPFDTIRKKMQAQSLMVPSHMRPDVEFKGF
jgi:solute carrier family 25 protein 43